jgi:hypothetical protein
MKILGCEMVPFSDDTERAELDELVIVGRARLTPEGGGLIHALVCRCPVDGRHFAAYLNRHTGRFEIFAVEASRD